MEHEQELDLGMATIFRDAVKQSVVTELRKPEDWERFNEIHDTARKDEQIEKGAFRDDYAERHSKALKDLIDKAGSHTFEHPTPFGTDRFNTSDNTQQAKTKVENDHLATMLGIVERETQGYDQLSQDIHVREHMRDRARDDFTRATDRRTGEDRRQPQR